MKKLLSIALCAAAVSAFAASTETILGQVGVTAINSGLKNTIVAVSYDDLADASGSGIVVSNFVKTTNLTADDQLAIFNNGLYDTWTLKEKEVAGGVKVKYWEKNAQTYTVGSDGKLVAGTGVSADLVSRSVGTGIWLVRQNSSQPFYIYGKPVSDPVSQIYANTWTLIGNPTQTSVDPKDLRLEGISTGDQIVAIDTNGNPKYYTYKKGSGWQRNNAGQPESLLSIGAGLGVWVRAASDAKIHWTPAQQ